MEYTAFRRGVIMATCCLGCGAASLLLAAAGLSPVEMATAGIALLVGIGGLVWLAVPLWAVVRGETAAYRLFYHADVPPDGKAIAGMLCALARNAGHVGLVWLFRPSAGGQARGTAGSAAAELAPRQAGPDQLPPDAAGPPEGDEGSDLPGKSVPGLMSSVSLHIVVPAAAAPALEGMIPALLPGVWAERCEEPKPLGLQAAGRSVRAWRWEMGQSSSGTLADPLACGANLADLALHLRAGLRPDAELGDLAVYLKLWPAGISASVAARCRPTEVPLREKAEIPPTSTRSTDNHESLPSPQEAGSSISPPSLSPPSFLKPIGLELGLRWPAAWPHGAQSRTDRGGRRARQHRSGGLDHSTAFAAPAASRLVSVLAARYPLWKRTASRGSSSEGWSGRREGREGQRAAQVGADPAQLESPGGEPPLLFPATRGPFRSLDSVEAREVAPPASYHLPQVRSQVFVLGRATRDGRAVGIPALKRSDPRSASTPQSAASSENGAGSVSTGGTAATGTQVPHSVTGARMRLHPMLAEHILVAGGSDAWRRDVAGSLVSQALEIGMTVVVVDGGSPPDEPVGSVRKRSRIVSPDTRGGESGRRSWSFAGSANSGFGFGVADPLSPPALRLGSAGGKGSARIPGIAQIDMDNPAGSVRPNMLYVPAPPELPPVEGEALATSQALRTGLPAQMRFLEAVNVTGIDSGMSDMSGVPGQSAGGEAHLEAHFPEAGPGMLLVEAWLTMLLLRHHRARLLLASRGNSQPPERGSVAPPGSPQQVRSGSSPSHLLPSCPDLPALSLVLEQTDTLLSLLRRERDAWADPGWTSLVQARGGEAGNRALLDAQEALERVAPVGQMDRSDLLLYGAAVRGQLARVLANPGLMHMLRGPHVSLTSLLHGGVTRMLRVNLAGAYRTAALPHGDDDLARKQYGLYLLWALWAASRQREAMQSHTRAYGQVGSSLGGEGHRRYAVPHPTLLLLHGAGAWFGSGSPLSERKKLLQFGEEASGIAVAATVSGLRHLRTYREGASNIFGTLVLGPPPVAELDAPEVVRTLVAAERRLLRGAMHQVADVANCSATNVAQRPPQHGEVARYILLLPYEQIARGDELFGVLGRTEDGTALVVTNGPGGATVVCTVGLASQVATAVRGSWSYPP